MSLRVNPTTIAPPHKATPVSDPKVTSKSALTQIKQAIFDLRIAASRIAANTAWENLILILRTLEKPDPIINQVIHFKDNHGNSLAHIAAMDAQANALKELIRIDAPLHTINQEGDTPADILIFDLHDQKDDLFIGIDPRQTLLECLNVIDSEIQISTKTIQRIALELSPIIRDSSPIYPIYYPIKNPALKNSARLLEYTLISHLEFQAQTSTIKAIGMLFQYTQYPIELIYQLNFHQKTILSSKLKHIGIPPKSITRFNTLDCNTKRVYAALLCLSLKNTLQSQWPITRTTKKSDRYNAQLMRLKPLLKEVQGDISMQALINIRQALGISIRQNPLTIPQLINELTYPIAELR